MLSPFESYNVSLERGPKRFRNEMLSTLRNWRETDTKFDVSNSFFNIKSLKRMLFHFRWNTLYFNTKSYVDLKTVSRKTVIMDSLKTKETPCTDLLSTAKTIPYSSICAVFKNKIDMKKYFRVYLGVYFSIERYLKLRFSTAIVWDSRTNRK